MYHQKVLEGGFGIFISASHRLRQVVCLVSSLYPKLIYANSSYSLIFKADIKTRSMFSSNFTEQKQMSPCLDSITARRTFCHLSSTDHYISCSPRKGGHTLLLSARALTGCRQTWCSPLLVHLQQAGRRAHPDLSGDQAVGQWLGRQQGPRADLHRGRDDRHPGANRTGRVKRQRCHRPVRNGGLEQRMFTKNFSTWLQILHSRQRRSFTRLKDSVYHHIIC